MAYKVVLEGAGKGFKFDSKEEAVEAMWELYKDKMSRPDFDKFISDKVVEA